MKYIILIILMKNAILSFNQHCFYYGGCLFFLCFIKAVLLHFFVNFGCGYFVIHTETVELKAFRHLNFELIELLLRTSLFRHSSLSFISYCKAAQVTTIHQQEPQRYASSAKHDYLYSVLLADSSLQTYFCLHYLMISIQPINFTTKSNELSFN